MLDWVRNRILSFEVLGQRDGRWMLDRVCPTEGAAVARAREMLGDTRWTAAKVVQSRSMLNGFTTQRVVFEETAPPAAERPPAVRSPRGEVAVCASLDEFFGPDSRRLIALTLMEYLTRQQVTPTELLHAWSHVRRLQDSSALLMAAIHRVGTAQAKTTGEATRDRVNVLNRLVDEAVSRARDFTLERKRLPAFHGHDLDAFVARLGGLVDPARFDYVLRAQVSAWLADQRSLAGRLEVVLDLTGSGAAPDSLRLIDGLVADLLSFGEVVQDLFGALPNLGHFLADLADLLNGRPDGAARARDPRLGRIAALLDAGRLPETREVLLARLLKEMAADRPLDKLNAADEPALLALVVRRLQRDDGTILGGEAAEKAVAAREVRYRQGLLRAAGLHGIAENLKP
ncbi:hypothetical protein [Rhodocista pekingensis]|uniref:Uncharacterized protein n=1 Tax=Rhodocista pekingensis TaxID=201185 RepID=A0ABW2KS68_9PROT